MNNHTLKFGHKAANGDTIHDSIVRSTPENVNKDAIISYRGLFAESLVIFISFMPHEPNDVKFSQFIEV